MSVERELLYREVGRSVLQNVSRYEPEWEVRAENRAAELLEEVGKLLRDRSLDDFAVVDEIVSLFVQNGLDCRERHDFG